MVVGLYTHCISGTKRQRKCLFTIQMYVAMNFFFYRDSVVSVMQQCGCHTDIHFQL